MLRPRGHRRRLRAVPALDDVAPVLADQEVAVALAVALEAVAAEKEAEPLAPRARIEQERLHLDAVVAARDGVRVPEDRVRVPRREMPAGRHVRELHGARTLRRIIRADPPAGGQRARFLRVGRTGREPERSRDQPRRNHVTTAPHLCAPAGENGCPFHPFIGIDPLLWPALAATPSCTDAATGK